MKNKSTPFYKREIVISDGMREERDNYAMPSPTLSPTRPLEALDTLVVPHVERKFGWRELFSAGKSRDLRELSKLLLQGILGPDLAVRGLGVEVKLNPLTPHAELRLLSETLSNVDQDTLSPHKKLARATLHSSIDLALQGSPSPSNEDLIRHVRSHCQPGDIIFTSGDWHGQTFIREAFELVYRALSAESDLERKFPFMHTMIYLGDDRLLQIDFHGARETTIERAFVKKSYYEALAIGRLRLPAEARAEFCRRAENFSRGKAFNRNWALFHGPLQMQESDKRLDSSATRDRIVCVDAITEPAAAMAEEGFPISAELTSAKVPPQVFSAAGVDIIAAVCLARDRAGS